MEDTETLNRDDAETAAMAAQYLDQLNVVISLSADAAGRFYERLVKEHGLAGADAAIITAAFLSTQNERGR